MLLLSLKTNRRPISFSTWRGNSPCGPACGRSSGGTVYPAAVTASTTRAKSTTLALPLWAASMTPIRPFSLWTTGAPVLRPERAGVRIVMPRPVFPDTSAGSRGISQPPKAFWVRIWTCRPSLAASKVPTVGIAVICSSENLAIISSFGIVTATRPSPASPASGAPSAALAGWQAPRAQMRRQAPGMPAASAEVRYSNCSGVPPTLVAVASAAPSGPSTIAPKRSSSVCAAAP